MLDLRGDAVNYLILRFLLAIQKQIAIDCVLMFCFMVVVVVVCRFETSVLRLAVSEDHFIAYSAPMPQIKGS